LPTEITPLEREDEACGLAVVDVVVVFACCRVVLEELLAMTAPANGTNPGAAITNASATTTMLTARRRKPRLNIVPLRAVVAVPPHRSSEGAPRRRP
jgi:hypothetical protein